jgi:hypothetical protein
VVGHVDVAARYDNFDRGVHLVLTELGDVLEFTLSAADASGRRIR